jgi:hypothetical protein
MQFLDTEASSSQTFIAKQFRKEINILAQKSSKKKILELYANAIKQEQTNSKQKSMIKPLSIKLRKYLVIVIATTMSEFT